MTDTAEVKLPALKWDNCKVRLGDLRPWSDNPRYSTKAQAERIVNSFRKFNQVMTIAISPENEVYDGHQRLSALLTIYDGSYEIDARRSNRNLTDEERRALVLALSPAGAFGSFDWDKLSSWDTTQMSEWGFDGDTLKQWNNDANNLKELLRAEQGGADAKPQFDRAGELLEKWQVKKGDLWQLDDHRLICGDCTDADTVAKVMGDDKAVLIHADPPYGMGKENEGIANDNLYREKLDAFQIAWWNASRPFLKDNASAYIWGQDEDLWRLWYCGGLRDSERITFRNELVWVKPSGQGVSSETHRQYPTITERCLFFMLGEQGFNNNTDNYYDGWENIRAYLYDEIEKLKRETGMTLDDIGATCGVTGRMIGHFISKSQWAFISREYYQKLQSLALNYDGFKRDYDGFKRDYDELKRDYYKTRAYFDNTHDAMTDVWQFNRVSGAERFNHATPKPVEVMMRICKSSAVENDIVLEPFSGSGTTIIACENLKRKCRAIEISPAYVAVTLERFATAFPGVEIRRIDA